MKKFKFLKIFILAVGMTAVFSVVNSFAMEGDNRGVVILRRERLETNHARSRNIPKLADILERNETYVFDEIEGEPTLDPQYLVDFGKNFDGEKTYSFHGYDYYMGFYRNDGENVYHEHNNANTYEVIPPADQDSNYEVIKKDNKIYYIVSDDSVSENSNNLVCYELEVCRNRVWYKLNGKRRFFSTVGRQGYYMPLSKDKPSGFFLMRGYGLSTQDKDADKT